MKSSLTSYWTGSIPRRWCGIFWNGSAAVASGRSQIRICRGRSSCSRPTISAQHLHHIHQQYPRKRKAAGPKPQGKSLCSHHSGLCRRTAGFLYFLRDRALQYQGQGASAHPGQIFILWTSVCAAICRGSGTWIPDTSSRMRRHTISPVNLFVGAK